jgi:uncharacterized protein (DUF2141 family)
MKTLFTTIIALIITSLALAQDAHTLTVRVDNAKNDTGKMVYSLSTEDQFMKAAPLMAASVEIKDGVAVAVFENVPAGTYAVIVLHDKNGNESMDYDLNRRPTEAYGMSNNPMSYGPPVWDEAKFQVTESTEMIIRL